MRREGKGVEIGDFEEIVEDFRFEIYKKTQSNLQNRDFWEIREEIWEARRDLGWGKL